MRVCLSKIEQSILLDVLTIPHLHRSASKWLIVQSNTCKPARILESQFESGPSRLKWVNSCYCLNGHGIATRAICVQVECLEGPSAIGIFTVISAIKCCNSRNIADNVKVFMSTITCDTQTWVSNFTAGWYRLKRCDLENVRIYCVVVRFWILLVSRF